MTSVEPRVLIEVLSPSTMNYDRVKKLEEYKRLPSVRAVLLVDTETPRITVHPAQGARLKSANTKVSTLSSSSPASTRAWRSRTCSRACTTAEAHASQRLRRL